jgi:hypothetical protein
MMLRYAAPRAIVLSVTVFIAACGNNLVGPADVSGNSRDSTSALNLQLGLQLVTFLGLGLSSDPTLPPCAPLGVPSAGTSVSTQLMLTRDGSDWVARSPSPELGSIELRFRVSGTSVEGTVVTGSANGAAPDHGSFSRPPLDVIITLGANGGAEHLEGTASRSVPIINGTIAGTTAFSNSRDERSTCTVVQWMMQPASGISFP